MQAVQNLDLKRFMGTWYVIASQPTYLEKDAFNPIENYVLNDDGTITTTFTFTKGQADGTARTLGMTGFVGDEPNNGVWAMQWIWPIKADYRIAYLDESYDYAIIGRNKRDYVWLMSRYPNVRSHKLEDLLKIAVNLGYERKNIKLTNWQQVVEGDSSSAKKPNAKEPNHRPNNSTTSDL
jgi:apolipoprotein D and lipocalin family protein